MVKSKGGEMELFKKFIAIFIETSAFAILVCLFLKENAKGIIKKIVVILIAILLFTITDSANHVVMIAANYFIGLVSIKIAFAKSLNETLVALFLAASIGLSIQIGIIFSISVVTFSVFERTSFINRISFNLVFMIICMIIYRYSQIHEIFLKYKEEVVHRKFFILILSIYSIFLQGYWDKNEKLFSQNVFVFCLIIGVTLFFNINFMMYSIKLKEKEKIIEVHSLYSPIILKLIDDVRQKQHDFKNHINTIYGISQITEENKLKETLGRYINELNGSFQNIEDFIYLENMVVSAVLFSKSGEAKEKNIKLICDIKAKDIHIPLKEYETSIILNNLIDNAFEEVMNFESNREVVLTLGMVQDRLFIEVKNMGQPIDGEIIRKLFNKGFSTKAVDGRGYGLNTVKTIVQSCGGKIQMLFEEGYIILRIAF